MTKIIEHRAVSPRQLILLLLMLCGVNNYLPRVTNVIKLNVIMTARRIGLQLPASHTSAYT